MSILGKRFLSTKPAVAPFTVFQSSGMIMARPVPVQVSQEDPSAIAREGYVSLTLIPRSAEATFEKDKKLSVKLRARQIGQIISWKNGKPLSVNAYASGSVPITVEIRPSMEPSEEPMMEVTLKKSQPEPASVSVPISVGEVRALQVLLESALPSLYGWTVRSMAPTRPGLNSAQSAQKSPEEFFKQFSG